MTMLAPWHAGIDAQLVARLVRRPGIIGLGLANRITRGIEVMAAGLPLLARFEHKIRDISAAREPLVHPLPVAPSPAPPEAPPAPVVIARLIEHTATVERIAAPDPDRKISQPSREEPPPSAPAKPALVAAPPVVTAASEPVEPASAPSRRSRVGAPIVEAARPEPRHQTAAHVPGARPPAVSTGEPQITPVQEERHRPATSHVVDRDPHPVRVARLAQARAAIDPPRPATRPRESFIERRTPAGPLVLPRSTLVPAAVRTELAPPAPAAVPPAIAHAAPPVPVAPSPSAATPRVQSREASALPKIDLLQLAERVQGILERQAAHARARRGQR